MERRLVVSAPRLASIGGVFFGMALSDDGELEDNRLMATNGPEHERVLQV